MYIHRSDFRGKVNTQVKRGGQTGFLQRGADADGRPKLISGEALVDALVLLYRRVLDVDRADSRQLPDVNASNLERLVVFLPLVTATTIDVSLQCTIQVSIHQQK